MRFYYASLVAAAALCTSTTGLPTVTSSVASTSIRGTDTTGQQPFVKSKTNQFLIRRKHENAPTSKTLSDNTFLAEGRVKKKN